jgi:hypothetical protein
MSGTGSLESASSSMVLSTTNPAKPSAMAQHGRLSRTKASVSSRSIRDGPSRSRFRRVSIFFDATDPDQGAVAIDKFANPNFPAPSIAVRDESRKPVCLLTARHAAHRAFAVTGHTVPSRIALRFIRATIAALDKTAVAKG